MKNLFYLIFNFSKNTRLFFFGLVFLNIFASFAEVISIGAVIPFLGLLVNPYAAQEYLIVPSNIPLNFFTVSYLFVFSIIFSSLLRVFNLYLTIKFAFTTGSNLSIRMYENFLSSSFMQIKNLSSNHIVDLILNKSNQLSLSVMMLMNFVSSLFIAFGIILFLFFVNSSMALIIFGLSSFFYLSFHAAGKNYLAKFSDVTAKESNNLTRHTEEGYGLIREIKIGNIYEIFTNKFKNSDESMRKAMGLTQFLSQYPRFFIEAFIVTGLVIIINFLIKNNTYSASLLGVIGAFVFGMQRLLPVIQNAYGSYSNIRGYQDSVEVCIKFLQKPIKTSARLIEYFDSLYIKNLSFNQKDGGEKIFENLSFQLNKGDCIGILGKSGSGKTTFLEILMGLITPQKINTSINKKNIINISEFKNLFFYIPQHTFLFEGSVSQNIALDFDSKKIDFKKIKEILAHVDLGELNPKKMITHRGENVSIGQAQRIGIARAIYSKKEILIMDEPTSALDKITEKKFIKLLTQIKKTSTIVIATHKIEPLNVCNKIFIIRNKKLERYNSI